MKLNFSIKTLCAVAALTSSVASAQVTSSKRIPVVKDAGGEVVPTPVMRVDTVTVYRTDTVRVNGRIDTVRTTVTRYDTVMVTTEVMRPLRFPSGMYFGLAAGGSTPYGSLFTPNSTGVTAQAQLGWQRFNSPIGLRLDANYAQPGEDSCCSGNTADPDILNFNADVKLALPFLDHLFGMTPRTSFYAIGGGSHTMYKNLPIEALTTNGTTVTLGTTTSNAPSNSWTHEWGWNAGGGVSLLFGSTELFVESRLIQFNPDNARHARQNPIVLGLNWYGR